MGQGNRAQGKPEDHRCALGPCQLADAEHAGGGKVQVNGGLLDVQVFEAACRSGTGYFLVSQPPQKSLAISCFAADAAHTADMAQGAPPDEFVCTLSGNSDVKVMAASVLKGAGTLCDVSNYRWVGVSSKNGTEYSEVACADGNGYVLEAPTTAQVSVVGCQDAVKEGIKCALTAVNMPVTLQTFRDAIKDHSVDCEPAEIGTSGVRQKAGATSSKCNALSSRKASWPSYRSRATRSRLKPWIVGKDQTIVARVLGAADKGEPASLTVRRDGQTIATLARRVGPPPLRSRSPIDHAGPNVDRARSRSNRRRIDDAQRQGGHRRRGRARQVAGAAGVGRAASGRAHVAQSAEIRRQRRSRPFHHSAPAGQDTDGTPINELSLIAFPVADLFGRKIKDFDLIIFDRYSSQAILPRFYLDNIVAMSARAARC